MFKIWSCVRREDHAFLTAPNAHLLQDILQLFSSPHAAASAALQVWQAWIV